MKINLKTVLFLVSVPLILSSPDALAHTDVTAEQARELIDSTDDLTVVDVREPYEYSGAGGHIPGALNYPFNSGVLEARYEELPMDGPVLVVCGSGSRSNRAANFLDSMGFSMVNDMLGGMRAWIWETETGVDTDIKYVGGTGEPNDPYQIATSDDLMLLGESPEDYDKHFILTANIDLDPNLPGGKVFDRAVIAPDVNQMPWGIEGTPFTGVFDGNGCTISYLTVNGPGYLGLFGWLWGEVKDLGVVRVNISGSEDYVAGLAAVSSGIIEDCYASGTVSGREDVGGLAGQNGVRIGNRFDALVFSGSINDSYSNCDVMGVTIVGGLVGFNYAGEITRCYSSGAVLDSEPNQPFDSKEGFFGGLIGYSDFFGIEDGFWDIDASCLTVSAGGTGKTTAEMQTAGTFLEAGWDFVGETENGTEDIWSICEGTNYPRFVWQIPVGDFVCPDGITIDDFLFFLEHWLDDNCDISNNYCEGTDLDQSGSVDVNDLEILFENWSGE